jgi:phosphoribosylformimino-5-aminoimidazole carboxamide ribotide isomerase
MLLIPAIDLKDGQCVRLKQGDMDQATIFSEDPAAMARKWVDLGARRLHLVDLNGAFAGKPKNLEAIEAILEEVGDEIPCSWAAASAAWRRSRSISTPACRT